MKRTIQVLLVFLVLFSFSLTPVFCEPIADYRVHVLDTSPVDSDYEWLKTNFEHSSVRLKSISVGYWAPMGWEKIPLGYEQRWQVRLRILYHDPVVNVSELRIWIPSSSGIEWDNSLNIFSADPFPPGHADASLEYEGDGWYVFRFTAPEGEYFKVYPSNEPTSITFDFYITNSPLLELGQYAHKNDSIF